MNHPKGLTVDDRGNIYIADTMNMAIRKISDEGIFMDLSIQELLFSLTLLFGNFISYSNNLIYHYAGVTTIAGGKWTRGGGHVDVPSKDVKFSNDFDVVYIGSICSLLVIDRGNQAIREIQLHDEDCSYQYDGSFHLGITKFA